MSDSHSGAPGSPCRLRLRHRARPTELRAIRRRVGDWARAHALPAEVVVDLQLALGEAVANGVEHAYRADRPGTVDVELELRSATPAAVVVRVADHGTWQPIPLRRGHRGRGLEMIEHLAERVEVTATRLGTLVCFEIPLPAS